MQFYLSDKDFKKLFKMDVAKYAKLAKWKQGQKKKKVGLF